MAKSKSWSLCAELYANNSTFGEIYYPLKGERKSSQLNKRKEEMPDAYNKLYKEILSNVKTFYQMYCTKPGQINCRAKSLKRQGNQAGTLHLFLDILVNKLIPKSFYGPMRHKTCIQRLLTLMFTRSKNECIYTPSIYYGFDFDKVPWLESVDGVERKKKFLCLGIKRVLSLIVAPLFRKLYYPLCSRSHHKVTFVPRQLWCSYIHSVKHKLIKAKHIIPEQQNLVIGLLNIVPKNGLGDVNNFRAYVRANPKVNYKSKNEKKEINRLLYNLARSMFPISDSILHEHWKSYLNYIQGQQIYGVKLDVTDCFGNVDIATLIRVISSCGNKIPLYTKKYLVDKINKQYIHFGKEWDKQGVKRPKVYKWNRGLIQGDKFSAPLCEVYMSHMDSLHLKKFAKKGCFLQRKVDDYIFCSSDPQEVLEFIRTVSSYMKINDKKTQSNVYGDFTEIEYYGYLINLNTREIRKLYKFEENTQMHHNFKLWNPAEMKGPKRAMIYLAFKFDSAVMAAFMRKPLEKNLNLLQSVISITVFFYTKIAMKMIDGGNVKRNCFIKIGFNAFLLVLQKRQISVYRNIVKGIRELQNKIFVSNFCTYRVHQLPKDFENISK